MMILQHSMVVVEYSQCVTGVREELVTQPRVVHIVYCTRVQCCKHLQIREYLLEKSGINASTNVDEYLHVVT